MRVELDKREVQYGNDAGILKLIELLKTDEDERHKLDEKSFKNLTDFNIKL